MSYYMAEKFIFVSQDVRRKNGSEGKFDHMRKMILEKIRKADESSSRRV